MTTHRQTGNTTPRDAQSPASQLYVYHTCIQMIRLNDYTSNSENETPIAEFMETNKILWHITRS
ncbi:hypothetical protein KSC_015560 [Ktedonobacter sp. SOSP1-52]|nr:hypothetical protein KSC_015560 [Ktedonobacter sp. SOSP1-52]